MEKNDEDTQPNARDPGYGPDPNRLHSHHLGDHLDDGSLMYILTAIVYILAVIMLLLIAGLLFSTM